MVMLEKGNASQLRNNVSIGATAPQINTVCKGLRSSLPDFVKPRAEQLPGYYLFFKLLGRCRGLGAAQCFFFIKRVFALPFGSYALRNLRYYIDFKHLEAILPLLYGAHYALKAALVLSVSVYKVGKLAFALLKLVAVTSSFFLNMRKCCRQRLY